MATKGTGVYQKDNGYWEYRFVMIVDGKQINKKKSTDAFGNKLKTKKDAIKARDAAMLAARAYKEEKPKVRRRTVKEVFDEYCEKGRKDRAYQTIRKQDSIWENYLCERFGSRYVDDISVAEVIDYLSELYYIHNFSYMYTEAFLKMFYLIFGQAYSRNYLEVQEISTRRKKEERTNRSFSLYKKEGAKIAPSLLVGSMTVAVWTAHKHQEILSDQMQSAFAILQHKHGKYF